MTVESATYISQLNASYPADSDEIPEGDNHIRLIKAVLQAQFSSLGTAAVTATAAQLSNAARRDGQAYTGAQDFTGATVTVPTAAFGDNTTKAASTAHVAAAIAAVNAQTPLTLTIDASASISASVGQFIVCTAASTVTITLPAAPSAGDEVGVIIGNGRSDTVIARNGLNIMGLAENLTVDNANASFRLKYVNASLGWRLI